MEVPFSALNDKATDDTAAFAALWQVLINRLHLLQAELEALWETWVWEAFKQTIARI